MTRHKGLAVTMVRMAFLATNAGYTSRNGWVLSLTSPWRRGSYPTMSPPTKRPVKRAARKPVAPRREARSTKASPRAGPAPGFVGRAGSPVLERYPKKDPSLSVKGPPTASRTVPLAPPRPSPAPTLASAPTPGTTPAGPAEAARPSTPPILIALEKPFSVDEFAQLLGETNIRVTVPREFITEVLQRITDFMGFGIYVYSFRVRPAPSELLKEFVVELQRVDFSRASRDWIPFLEQGRSESPFGPTGQR
jgi:hypothetical protein